MAPSLPQLPLVQCWTSGHFRFPGDGDSGGGSPYPQHTTLGRSQVTLQLGVIGYHCTPDTADRSQITPVLLPILTEQPHLMLSEEA